MFFQKSLLQDALPGHQGVITTPGYYPEEEETFSEADKSWSVIGCPKKVEKQCFVGLSFVESPGTPGRTVCFQ